MKENIPNTQEGSDRIDVPEEILPAYMKVPNHIKADVQRSILKRMKEEDEGGFDDPRMSAPRAD